MRIGLALGGGGAKGSYQLGVLKALEEFNLLDKITYITGTSIGAINTMLLMNYNNIEDVIKAWDNIDNRLVYKSGLRLFSNGLYDLSPLFKKMSSLVSEKNIRKSKFECYITAAKVKDKEMRFGHFQTSNLELEIFHLNNYVMPKNAVLASASIPGVFGSTDILGNTYVDGGLLDNYVVEPLIEKKCDVIFVIPLDNYYDLSQYLNENNLIINFSSKTIFHDSRVLDIIDAIRFTRSRINERFLYGYLAAKRILKKMKKEGILDSNYSINLQNKIIGLEQEEELKILKKVKQGLKIYG
ncbi:patatin-like phospholipase family protein [Haploplasma axanthum]|uniref:Patatin n=1 Tax=Haploplasma axanthum TaxID=29552 RepID=A0A449BE02_HAPAX|nr:patatin-like phospholipase family protein [Haploplasma axanthum]VEU80658.1 Patatin [Haploplasma axanthum]